MVSDVPPAGWFSLSYSRAGRQSAAICRRSRASNHRPACRHSDGDRSAPDRCRAARCRRLVAGGSVGFGGDCAHFRASALDHASV